MMANFEKIKKDVNLTDSGVESDFTGSGIYTADIGKQIKENDIKKRCKSLIYSALYGMWGSRLR